MEILALPSIPLLRSPKSQHERQIRSNPVLAKRSVSRYDIPPHHPVFPPQQEIKILLSNRNHNGAVLCLLENYHLSLLWSSSHHRFGQEVVQHCSAFLLFHHWTLCTLSSAYCILHQQENHESCPQGWKWEIKSEERVIVWMLFVKI